jgi:hypothetical protein
MALEGVDAAAPATEHHVAHGAGGPAPPLTAAAHGAAAPVVVAPDPLAAARAALANVPDTARARLEELEARERNLTRERAQLRAKAKAVDRKRQRLVDRARGLSAGDLMGLVASRLAAPAVKAKAKRKAKHRKPWARWMLGRACPRCRG